MREKQLESIENEIFVLSQVKSERIVRLHGAYKTTAYYYMIMDVCNGGDLNMLK